MDLLEARTRAWYEWELRGRGWQLSPYEVALEPPLVPLQLPRRTTTRPLDDARHTTWLSRLVEGFGKQAPEETVEEPEEDEPQPIPAVPSSDLAEYRLLLSPETLVQPLLVSRWLSTLTPCGPLSFEIIGSGGEVSVALAGERSDLTLALDSLQSFLPESQIEGVPGFLDGLWGREQSLFSATEFALAREFMLPLRSPSHRSQYGANHFSPDPLTPLIGALATTQANEVGLLQVLFEEVRAPWAEHMLHAVQTPSGEPFFADAPEISQSAQEKAASPLFAVALRVAARAPGERRVWELLKRLAGGLSQFGSPQLNELIPLQGDLPTLEQDILRRTTHRSGMLLNATELLAFVHPPSENIQVSSLVRTERRTKQAPEAVLESGLFLGENTHRGEVKEVRLSEQARLRHTHVIGASGTGKSTLLVQMILRDVEAGGGVGVLDPHGDLVDDVLARLPPERANDVVLFDPSDDQYTVGWNILGARTELERELLASDLVGVFRRLSTSWGDQMTSVLSNAVLVFLDSTQGGTLLDLRKFLVDGAFRKDFLQTVRDEHLKSWWQYEFPLLVGKKPQAPILVRLDTFLRSARIRRIVTVRKSLDFRALVDSKKIFLAKLAQGAIGVENAALLGSLLVSKIHQVTLSRQELAARDRQPFYLYLDEFHEMATPSMATLFSGVRKYRLGLIVAHQDLYQLHAKVPDVERAVLANAHSRICFRLGDDDARVLGKGFSYFTQDDLMGLQIGQAIVRVGERDADFNLATEKLEDLDEQEAAEQRQTIRELSGRQWGEQREPESGSAETKPEATETQGEMSEARTPEPAPKEEATPKTEEPAPLAPQLDKPSLDYLALVATEPFLTVRERNQALQLSAWKGQQQKTNLLEGGLISEVAINPGSRGSQFKLLELTTHGREVLQGFGVKVSTGHGRGGVAHQWWVNTITSWLEEQGHSPSIESETRGVRVDIHFPSPEGDIALEIETSDGHEAKNITKDLQAGYPLVVSLHQNPRSASKLVEEFKNAEGVRIGSLRDFEPILLELLAFSAAPNQNKEPGGRKRAPRRKNPPERAAVAPPHDWNDPGALTTPLAAKYLGLAPATLETLRSRGGGPPFVKLGRRVVYRREDLDAWLQERVRKSTSDD